MNYTREDFFVLNKMVEYQPSLEMGIPKEYYYDEGLFRYFDPDILAKTSIPKIKKKILKRMLSIAPYKKHYLIDKCLYKELEKKFRYAFMRAPLEEIPLYINESFNIDIIAQWRLKIGK